LNTLIDYTNDSFMTSLQETKLHVHRKFKKLISSDALM